MLKPKKKKEKKLIKSCIIQRPWAKWIVDSVYGIATRQLRFSWRQEDLPPFVGVVPSMLSVTAGIKVSANVG